MHSAAFGRILSPRRISLNCGGSYYITRNGGGHDKLVFFSDGGYPPIENKGVGGGRVDREGFRISLFFLDFIFLIKMK